jgi:N-formylglutamate amidohydrolase
MELHQKLVALYHDSFHREIEQKLQPLRHAKEVFHLDCHSMPSSGTAAHADSGAKRADVVLSDFEGKSSRSDFLDCLKRSFESEGLSVSINWPYKGGRITQRYGNPMRQHHTLQIELNRALYLNEETREQLSPEFSQLQLTLTRVIEAACNFALEHSV